MDTIIRIENLSKQYRLGVIGTRTLRGDLQRWIANIQGKEDPFLKIGEENKLNSQSGEYVWALRDINLEVERGEVLGIIGKNGAGKSTLLKILSRVTGPTTGSIKTKGRIASLLEVGTGFHPELTGRENIFLNGAILGMTKQEVKSKLDEIVSFAGVEKYLDTPVKRYSSGMYVRLAFAVAAHLEPDILVVDEVLAVGDAEFQQKAIGKMQTLSNNSGRTVLFVSHNMSSVESLCSHGILLENGQISFSGNINETIIHYLNKNRIEANYLYNNSSKQKEEVYLTSALLTDQKGNLKDHFTNLEPVFIRFNVNIRELNPFIKIGFELFQDGGKPLIASFHNDLNDNNPISLKKGENTLVFKIPDNLLNKGRYFIKAVATIHRVKWIYELDGILSFFVTYKLLNSKMQIEKRPSIIAPIIECKLD